VIHLAVGTFVIERILAGKHLFGTSGQLRTSAKRKSLASIIARDARQENRAGAAVVVIAILGVPAIVNPRISAVLTLNSERENIYVLYLHDNVLRMKSPGNGL
jgi:hypothetical protein